MADGEVPHIMVMEKTWERIQKKTFTGWCNNHLKKRGLKIEEISTDLSSGILLYQLLEIISDEKMEFKFVKNPKMKIQKIQNVNFCLKFIEQHGVKLVGIGAEEVVDENEKMILGMIWTIILRFAIQDISLEELSARDALLLWCQRKTEGYEKVNVKNFHMSFQDGLAFCALIHRHRPDLLDYHALDKNDKAACLEKAFSVAEESLDIPRLLDVSDMLDMPKPDERSVITYVSMYYHVFASSGKAEAAGKRVSSLIDFLQETDRVKKDYSYRADELVKWINAKNSELGQNNYAGDIDGLQGQIKELADYKTGEKPPKAQEKVELEGIFNSLQTKLSLNNRPPFQPADGLSPREIDGLWTGLEKTEHERNLALRNELRRLKRIKELVDRFTRKAGILETWMDSKNSFLSSDSLGETLSEVNAKIKNHDGFEAERAAQGESKETLRGIAADLQSMGYNEMDRINAKMSDLDSKWATLESTAATRLANLKAKHEELIRVENMLLDFAKRAMKLRVFLDRAEEDLTEPINCDTVQECQALQTDLQGLQAKISQEEAEYNALKALAGDISAAGVSETTFSEVSSSDLDTKWSAVASASSTRFSNLAAEAEKQAQHDVLRQQFADSAASFDQWSNSKSSALQGISGDAEAQLEALRQLSAEHEGKRGDLQSLEDLDKKLVDNDIFENPLTSLTIEGIKQDYNGLGTLIKEKEQAINSELAAQNQSGLSADQRREFQECFTYFDKNNDSLLDRLEFGACIRSLGQDISLEAGSELDNIISQYDADKDGQINFDEFLAYMESVSITQDTPSDVANAFKILAGEKDYVTEADLRTVLPADKVDFCLQNMQPYPGVDGGYDYNSFSQFLYA